MKNNNQGKTDEQYNASNTPAMIFAVFMIAVIIAGIYQHLTHN